MGPKNRPANEKKSYFCWSRKSWLFFLITLFMNMKNGTILLFSGSLSKICCTKLDLLQDIRKFYGALFDVPGFLKYERRHQSVAFNSLATQWVYQLVNDTKALFILISWSLDIPYIKYPWMNIFQQIFKSWTKIKYIFFAWNGHHNILRTRNQLNVEHMVHNIRRKICFYLVVVWTGLV